MRQRRRRLLPALVSLSLAAGAALTVSSPALAGPAARTASPAPPGQPWLQPGLSDGQRADLLLAHMTLQDKIAELHADKCPTYEACVPANARLGLPELVLEDDSTGVAAGMEGVTALPASIAASASWDPSLASSYGSVIGREERAKGVNVALAPTVNIMRAPQWGRNFESLGEDPYLTSQIGVADMEGIQGQGIIAAMKHFAVYNQETNRHTINAVVSSRVIHEIYLPAWAAAVQHGLGSVMASYNAVNGVSNSQNPYMLTHILRDQLGFTGFVRSDGGGTYSTVPAAEAGLNMQVKGVDYFAAPLQAAVQDGQVSMATINSMVRPILAGMFKFNLVGKPWGQGTTTENVITPQDTQVALDSAEQGTVLLKNQGGLLPLSSGSLKSVAVVGPDASPGMAEGGGSANVSPPFVVSPVQGIQSAAKGATVSYAAGLPDPSSLPAIPAQYLSQPYKTGNSYTATLTPPASGRYTLVVKNTHGYSPMTLSVNGQALLTAAGTTGDQFGSGSVDFQAGQHYQIQISGPSSSLAWATPADRSAAVAQAVTAARKSQVAVVVVGDHESEAIDRVRIGLSAGQNQLVEAVAAANPDTIVVLNTGGPVLMPWLSQVKSVVEAWYPGEEDGTALANVLFGMVDPAGHLPETFPASMSQMPTSSPSQFPGVNGQADYSEGLDVGYRWYDAHDVMPSFPFGYGLSYTTFSFGHLSVSPGPVTSLGTVRVSATVTNTGSRAGSEVAQLYVGDPASAGEPPRQLKGFQKVTLAPGRSARVHFTLTGHDLSYYDSTAHTWVVPEGAYQVYVGDSSAVSGLPLHGTFQVAGTTGSRHVTLAAPARAQAGTPFTVSATLAAGGNLTLQGARLALTAPAGWTVRPAGPPASAGTLAPSQPMTASWQVTAPAAAQDNIGQLTATATYHAAGPAATSPGAPSPGGTGTSTARSQITIDPLVTTTLTPSSVTAREGQPSQVTLRDTDTSGYPVRLAWAAAPPAGSGVTITPTSGTATLTPGAAASTTLSVTGTAPGTVTVPIAATATAGPATQPTPGAYLTLTIPYPNLTAAYNNTGITTAADPGAGDFSGSGITYPAGALARLGLSPGAAVTHGGISFTWPDVAAGQPDNVVASGQSIAIQGTGSDLGFLGASDYGNSSGTGTVVYTDGSTQSFTLAMSDYYATTPATGDQVLAIAPYRHSASGISQHTASIYYTAVPLESGKTVAYVTLPDISPGVANGTTAMHIFAMAIGK